MFPCKLSIPCPGAALLSDDKHNGLNGAVTYKAFGLTVSSSMPCPELLPGAGEPDVTVTYGDVPRDLAGAKGRGVCYQAAPGELLLRVDGVAQFLVRGGSEIIIDRHPAASDDDVRLFLLGSAFGALLHQRGILALHGSTVKVGDGCVVFLGRSGMGKSTLATILARRGYPCLGDDVAPSPSGRTALRTPRRPIPRSSCGWTHSNTLESIRRGCAAFAPPGKSAPCHCEEISAHIPSR